MKLFFTEDGSMAFEPEIYSFSKALFQMSVEDNMCTIYIQNVLNVTYNPLKYCIFKIRLRDKDKQKS